MLVPSRDDVDHVWIVKKCRRLNGVKDASGSRTVYKANRVSRRSLVQSGGGASDVTPKGRITSQTQNSR